MYGGIFRGTKMLGGLCVKVKCPECGEPTLCWKNQHNPKDYHGLCPNCMQAVQIQGLF